MASLPVDPANPAIRDFLALVRLQVLTPLSLLINIITVLVCSVLVRPSIVGIIELYPASISPHPAWLSIYVILIYLFQVGYCLLLVYSNVALLVYHAPTYNRPFDMALIHAPLRFFMVLPLSLLFPYSLFITVGLAYDPSRPEDYTRHPWPGFAVVMSTNLLSAVVVLFRRDVIWAIAATWICISIWSASPKPTPVFMTVVLFMVLHPLGLISGVVYDRLSQREGRIALPIDEAERARYEGQGQASPALQPQATQGPREVEVEAVWDA